VSEMAVNIRACEVTGLKGAPDGSYIFRDDVVTLLTTLGMLTGNDFSREINQLKELK
jgi:hypothetical protein